MTQFWTTPKKIAFTIALAVIVWMLVGCNPYANDKFFPMPLPSPSGGDTDAMYLQHLYATYNEQYFHNRLTTTPYITMDLANENEADTECTGDDGSGCTIRFNLHYVAAPRTAQSVLLHEMCHIKVWKTHISQAVFPPDSSSEFYHDRVWRSCMLSLDAEGAFRVINIDYYREDIH
jgi:hypothetical protein